MKLLYFILFIIAFSCSRPNENIIFCHIERDDNAVAQAIIEFEIDGKYTKETVLLPYGNIYYVDRYIIVRWLPQRIGYNGYLIVNKNKYEAEWDEWNLYKQMQVNIKRPNGMNGSSWLW